MEYCTTSKAYRLWCPQKQKIVVTRDEIFFDEETSSHFSTQSSTSSSSSFLPNYYLIFPIASTTSQSSLSINTNSDSSSENVSSPFVSIFVFPPEASPSSSSVGDPSCNSSGQPSPFFSSDTYCLPDSFLAGSPLSFSTPSSPSPASDDTHHVLRTRAVKDLYRNTVPVHSTSTTFVAATKKTHSPRVAPLPPEPQTYSQAIKSEHHIDWQQAMMEKIESLLKNEMWSFETLPPGRTTVKNKRVYQIKVKYDGIIECFKARLVAKGFTQTHGMDYTETFAPTARAESIRIILSIVVLKVCL